MDGAAWVLIVAMLLYVTTLLIHRFVDSTKSPVRLPVTWFYASWLIGLLLLTLPIFKYFESFSETSGTYFIAILFSFSLGSLTAAFWNNTTKARFGNTSKISNKTEMPDEISLRWIVLLLAFGLIGTSLLLLNSVLGGGLSITERFDSDNLSAIRLEHMLGTGSNIGLLYGPANIMSSIGGLGMAFAFYMYGARAGILKENKVIIRLAFAVLITNITIGFIGFGSRMFVVFAGLVAFFAFTEGRWSIGERMIVKKLTTNHFLAVFMSAVILLITLWAAATFFLEKRVQNQDPQTLLFRTHRASFTPTVYELTRDDTTAQYFLFSLSYLTTPIPTLAFYLDLPESRQPGPFFGEYNFPAFARWGRRLTFLGDPFAWERARYEIFKPLGDIQFGTNVWATLSRDLIADFTKIGALAFTVGLGFLSQRVFDLQATRPSARRAGLLIYLRLILLFAGMLSILFMPQIHWPLYLVIFFVLRGSSIRAKHKLTPPFHG